MAWLAWLALPCLGLGCLSAWLVLANSNNNPKAGGAALRAAVVVAVAAGGQGQARLRGKPGQAKARQAKQAKPSKYEASEEGGLNLKVLGSKLA